MATQNASKFAIFLAFILRTKEIILQEKKTKNMENLEALH